MYPSSYPAYQIVNQGTLLGNQTITIRRNSANEELIRLNFNSVKNIWANSDRRNVCDAFKEISREINHPPLLAENSQNLHMTGSFRNIPQNQRPSAKFSGKLA